VLLLSVLAQATTGFAPASRTDSAREISREPNAKSAANRHVPLPDEALGEPPILGHPAPIPRALTVLA
jgi:hypothetical protein